MEVELMVTKRDDDNRRPTDRQGEYRAICSGRWNGRVLQLIGGHCMAFATKILAH